MKTTDGAPLAALALAALAENFPDWHIWRSRDRRGRDDAWNATRRRKPRPVPSGVAVRVTAPDADGLRGLLEQQRAADAAMAAQAA